MEDGIRKVDVSQEVEPVLIVFPVDEGNVTSGFFDEFDRKRNRE